MLEQKKCDSAPAIDLQDGALQKRLEHGLGEFMRSLSKISTVFSLLVFVCLFVLAQSSSETGARGGMHGQAGQDKPSEATSASKSASEAAAKNFELYTRKIESRLRTESPVAISDLWLVANGDLLTASGAAGILADGKIDLDKTKLWLALVEEVVHYSGSNGIHFHRFVVRKLLGSPEGIPLPKSGEPRSFREFTSLTELASGIRKYLDNYEKEHDGFRFADKPDVSKAISFGVVAFVQNEETREILPSSFARCDS